MKQNECGSPVFVYLSMQESRGGLLCSCRQLHLLRVTVHPEVSGNADHNGQQ